MNQTNNKKFNLIELTSPKVILFCFIIISIPYFTRIFNFDYYIFSYFEKRLSDLNQKKENQKKLSTIIIGYVEFYPYTYTDNNKPSGIFIEKTQTIFDYYKKNIKEINYIYKSLPAARLFESLKNGSVHIFIGIKEIPSIQPYTYNGNEVIGNIEMRIYYLNKTPLKIIRNVEDFKEESVILIRGYGYTGWADWIKKNNIQYIEALDHYNAFELLQFERAKFLLEYKEPAEMVIKDKKYDNLNYQVVKKLDCFFIVSKKLENAEILLKNLDNIHKQLYR